MWERPCLAGLLALGLLFAPCSAFSEPSPSSPGVYLSQSEADAIEAEILAAQEALRKSNETIAQQSQLLTQAESNLKASNEIIAKQSRDLTMLSIFCGGLAGALVLEGVGLVIVAIKR